MNLNTKDNFIESIILIKNLQLFLHIHLYMNFDQIIPPCRNLDTRMKINKEVT